MLTKIYAIICTLQINFQNHKQTPSKEVTCKGIEPNALQNFAQCKTTCFPQPHPHKITQPHKQQQPNNLNHHLICKSLKPFFLRSHSCHSTKMFFIFMSSFRPTFFLQRMCGSLGQFFTTMTI
jgi:hypothetical protein